MATNQTIDGVPRELLENFASYAEGSASGQVQMWVTKLRALLDAPGIEVRDKCGVQMVDCHECSHQWDHFFECGNKPAAQPQGEQVAHMPVERCHDVRAKMIIAFNEAKKAGGDLDDALDSAYKSALRYSPNPLSAEQADRSPEAYAIEHAEYMAKSADDVLAKFQTYGLALLAVDEGGDDGEGELFENIDSARGDLQESLVDLRSMVYEFRKRSAKSR